jgi:hypothetical protein
MLRQRDELPASVVGNTHVDRLAAIPLLSQAQQDAVQAPPSYAVVRLSKLRK